MNIFRYLLLIFTLKALDDAIRLAKSEELVIPFGVGIAGHVAESKEVVNIKDAYKDPRFNSEIDLKTGYKTNIILSMAICNYEGDVIGVAQIINKTNGEIIEIDVVVRLMGSFTNVLVTQTGQEEFTERDVEVFKRYLTFCGIGENKFPCGFFGHFQHFFATIHHSTGIQNAQLFENSVLEYKRNQILLNLARSIFEEQNNLECLVTKIMKEARDLLKCERCAVFLVDLECCEAVMIE